MIYFLILLRAFFIPPFKKNLILIRLQNKQISLNKSKNQHLGDILSLLSNHIVFHFTEKKQVKIKFAVKATLDY